MGNKMRIKAYYLHLNSKSGLSTDITGIWDNFKDICRNEYNLSAAEMIRRFVVEIVKMSEGAK